MPAQRVLVLPVPPLRLLARQRLRVPDLARPHPQVAHHGHEVEADLLICVARDAAPQHLHDLGGELVRGARTVADGRGLQAVELVQRAPDGRVRDEVERVLGLPAPLLRRLVRERAALREAVVHVPDQLAVAQRLAPELGRQHHCELAELAQRRADVDARAVTTAAAAAPLVLVQEH